MNDLAGGRATGGTWQTIVRSIPMMLNLPSAILYSDMGTRTFALRRARMAP
jgi:hypothetical protein